MSKYFLGIDEGTTGITALLFDKSFEPVARGYAEITQYYPENGWVEHDTENIWSSLKIATAEALEKAGAGPEDIIAIGIDHEGESVALWDKSTGESVYPAIVWQDMRTAQRAKEGVLRETRASSPSGTGDVTTASGIPFSVAAHTVAYIERAAPVLPT